MPETVPAAPAAPGVEQPLGESADPALVSIEGLSVHYLGRESWVLDAVDLTHLRAQVTAVIGPSGCGKTTLVRALCGLIPHCLPSEYAGSLRLADTEVADATVQTLAQTVAYVGQSPDAAVVTRTVHDDVAFPLQNLCLARSEITARVEQALRAVGLIERIWDDPWTLSGGQRQRVAVGRAIVRNPKVFLFDEPLSNLDAKLRVQMRAEISDLHNRLKATMIYVTHDQVEAMTMGDKIVVMKDGKVQQIGSPLYLYNHPVNKFVAGFIGSPPMNFLNVKVIEKNGSIAIDEGTFVLQPTEDQQKHLKKYIGKNVFFGIRPEDLQLVAESDNAKNSMTLKITVKEPLGAETHLYLASKNQQVIARTFNTVEAGIGESLHFVPNMEKARFFDNETEANICEDVQKQ